MFNKEIGQMAERPLCSNDIASALHGLQGKTGIALAVAGGPDSIAIMHLVRKWLDSLGAARPKISVLTVDHGLRAGSDAEAKWVKQQAMELGFTAAILNWTDPKPDSGLQEAAREARYDLISAYCLGENIPVLLTAHHLDDQAETFLMRLARGSGVDGLAAIPEKSFWAGIEIRRPLLDFPKSQLIATLKAMGRDWIEDPSNADERFERVRIRRLLIEIEKLGISTESLARTAKRMRRVQRLLDQMTDQFLRSALFVAPAGYCTLNRDELMSAADEIALRSLGRCLCAISGNRRPPRLAKLEAVFEDYKQGDWRNRTLSGCYLMDLDGTLFITRELRPPGPPEVVLNPGDSAIWDRRFRVALPESASAPARVRALTEAGYHRVRKRLQSDPALPAAVGAGLVSFWDADDVVAVPHLSYYSEDAAIGQAGRESYKADFLHRLESRIDE